MLFTSFSFDVSKMRPRGFGEFEGMVVESVNNYTVVMAFFKEGLVVQYKLSTNKD